MVFSEFAASSGVLPIAAPMESPEVMLPDPPPPQKIEAALPGIGEMDAAWPDIPPPKKLEASLQDTAVVEPQLLASAAEMGAMWPDMPPPKK